MFIHYKDGASRSGLIVGLKGGIMRVALAGSDDLLEFRLVDDTWVSDECEIVSFDFPPGISQHEEFRAAVVKAVKPLDRLYGYIDAHDRISDSVN